MAEDRASMLRALKELATTGNAEMEAGELDRMIGNYNAAYLLGYVYGRTHIDQMFDPPEVPATDASEDTWEYVEGWCDAQYTNIGEEMGWETADAVADEFTANKADYGDILRYYRGGN